MPHGGGSWGGNVTDYPVGRGLDRRDDAALGDLAASVLREAEDDDGGLAAAVVGKEPAAVRRRVVRAWLVRRGVRESDDAQVRAVDALVARWRGQGPPSLPGGLEVIRTRGRLTVRPAMTGG